MGGWLPYFICNVDSKALKGKAVLSERSVAIAFLNTKNVCKTAMTFWLTWGRGLSKDDAVALMKGEAWKAAVASCHETRGAGRKHDIREKNGFMVSR